MPIDDFLNSQQPPPLGPEDLGVPSMPQAPMMPQAPQKQGGAMQAILQALPGILGGAMGPGAGTGLLQGTVMGSIRNQEEAQQRHRESMAQFQVEQHAYNQQLQQQQIAARQREQVLQQNLTALRSQVKDLPDKAAYDAYVEAYGNGLQSMGYRLDANWLRKTVPYVAPSADKKAWAVLEKWQKLPNNKELLEKHPEQAANAMIPFDRDDDGIPEMIRLQDLSVLAGAPLAMTADGQVFGNPGTPLDVKANADGILQQLIAKSKAEKKQITPELLITLQQEAIRLAKQASGEGTPARDERIVQVEGPDGKAIWVKESQAVGKPAAQAARAVTGQERQTLAFYNRAKESDDLAVKFEESVASQGLGSQYQQQYAPNVLQTREQQQYRQAQRAFTEARLRKESGAAIPVAEYENDARTYFAQPGDDAATRAQKRQARQTVLEGLKFSSGRAYEEFFGEAAQRTPPTGGAQQWVRDPATGKMRPR